LQNLIDLAGSESSKAETTGLRQKEGSYINKSLLTLGTVRLTNHFTKHAPRQYILVLGLDFSHELLRGMGSIFLQSHCLLQSLVKLFPCISVTFTMLSFNFSC
jgi:hypothetical protein